MIVACLPVGWCHSLHPHRSIEHFPFHINFLAGSNNGTVYVNSRLGTNAQKPAHGRAGTHHGGQSDERR